MADRFVDAFTKVNVDDSAGDSGAIAGAVLASEHAYTYVHGIQHEIVALQERIDAVADTNKSVEFAKGDAAEMWHEGTARIDAARQGHEPSAIAPRETIDHGPDLVFGDDRADAAQLKYHGDARSSARAVADPGYADQQKVIPADQLDDAKQWLRERADALDTSDPVTAERYRHAADTISDRATHGDVESHPLTEQGSRDLVDHTRAGHLDTNDLGLSPDQVIGLGDALRESAQAAAIAVGVQVAAVVVTALQNAITEGSVTVDDLEELITARGENAATSAVSGTVAAALTLAAESGQLGDLATGADPSAISLIVVLAARTTVVTVKAARGVISWGDAGYEIARNSSLVTSAAIGAAIGTAIAPGIGTVIGSILGASMARVGTTYTERVVLTAAVTSGSTYFGMVKQDVQLPEDVLRTLGWDTLTYDQWQADDWHSDQWQADDWHSDQWHADSAITPMGRGVIGVRTVGYVA